jgi:predicted nucleic acid-binding protein
MESLETGGLSLHCGEDDLGGMRELVGRHGDLPLGSADASVVACAEAHGGRVLTVDRRDFLVVAREGRIEVRPA